VAKITRACMSMANRRDGGVVVVGVGEASKGELLLEGLKPAELATWRHDDLADTLSEYADPGLSFESQFLEYEGKTYLVIEVREFPDVPALCKRDYQDVLRKGACYVRTRRKPESVEIPTQEGMRDLLDLGIEKGVRRFLTQAHLAGHSLSGAPPPSDEDQFDSELSDLAPDAP